MIARGTLPMCWWRSFTGARGSRGNIRPANPLPTLMDSCSARPASCTSCYGITIRRL